MPRKYDASRRKQAAQRTREEILDAAFKLHGLGITDYESLASEANVSVATVRKHFPTREILYEHCTAWGWHYASTPDLDELASTTDAAERATLAVRQLFTLYESLFGQLWLGYRHRQESPVVTRVLNDLDGLRSQVVALVLEPWPQLDLRAAEARGLANGLLGFLAYRSLREDGGLTTEQAIEQIAAALLCRLEALCRGRREGAASD